MTGAPTTTVKLDDGTGTYPIDITSSIEGDVVMSNFGRTDEFGTATASQLTFTLDNTTGSFSTGVGFGGGGFGGGGFGGAAIGPGQFVRWTITSPGTADRFTGRIESLDLEWPSGSQFRSTVTVTAVDILADLSRRVMRSLLEQEILADNPVAYYTLSEQEGSTAAGDTSNNGAPTLRPAGTGIPVVFGNGTGPTDGLTAAQFAGGQYLVSPASPTLPYAGTADSTVEAFFATTASGSTMTLAVLSDTTNITARMFLQITSAGKLFTSMGISTGVTSAASVNDGLTHHAVATYNNTTTTLTLYLDGVAVGSTASSAPLTAPASTLWVGNVEVSPGNGSTATPYTGTLSHVATYSTALSAARVASHAGVLTGFVEQASVRASRIAGYAGLTCTTTTPSFQTVATQATSGGSILDALQTVALAEGGVLYADGTGNLQMQGRNYRAFKTTPTVALVAEEPDPTTTVPFDTQQLFNYASVTGSTGAAQVYYNAASVASIGQFPASQDTIVTLDESALYGAQWLVNKHLTPTPRIPSLTVNPYAPAAPGLPAAMTAIKIGDRISLTMPSQEWATAADCTIEGWSETVSAGEWSITFNLVPWTISSALIFDNAINGKFDADVFGY